MDFLGGIFFSLVGMGALAYGRKMQRPRIMWLGGGLMVYSYFVTGPLAVFGVGALLTAALFVGNDG